jgi:hypothetical protein
MRKERKMLEISDQTAATGSRPARLLAISCDVTREASLQASIDEKPADLLEALKAQFRSVAKVSDDYAVNAAHLVKRMRSLVELGAAGAGVTWYSWARRLGLPPQRVQRYLRIADASNLRAMRDEYLRQDRERAKRSRRKRKRKEAEVERKRLIAWSRRASLTSVVQVLALIEKEDLEPFSLQLENPSNGVSK